MKITKKRINNKATGLKSSITENNVTINTIKRDDAHKKEPHQFLSLKPNFIG
jgi:hypothetical protein